MRRAEIFRVLNRSIYKMDAVKERIETHLIASNYTNHRSLRLLLVGSPGGRRHVSVGPLQSAAGSLSRKLT